MNNKKNIDRLFQEKFKDFEVAPNDAVWNRISESLPKKKKKRRVIALWWQIGGVAAVLALLLTAGVSVYNSDNNQDLPIVNTEDKNNNTKDNTTNSSTSKLNELNSNNIDKQKLVDSDANNESMIDEKENSNTSTAQKSKIYNQLTTSKKVQSNVVVSNNNKKTQPSQKFNNLKTVLNKDKTIKIVESTNNNKTNLKHSEETKLASESELKSAIKRTIKNNKTAIADNTTSKNIESESGKTENSKLNSTNSSDIETTMLKEDPKKESIIEAIAENKTETTINEKEDEQNRWSIIPNVAPVYYSSLGQQGSSLGQQFNNNTKTSDINMSYGIAGSYAISKRLKVRTGVNRINLNQSTSEVFAFTGPSRTTSSTASATTNVPFGNITFDNNVPVVSVISAKLVNMSASSPHTSGNLDQRFGFIEVPLELEYRLVDKKFGINVIGGFSTFFLNQNEIYADVEGTSTLIGEANNINSTSYSANLGLGMDYSLSKQWNINLEPTFKYQLNTFNNTSGDFRPFFVGVYTGLSFKF